jgi:hypothetical protein
MRARSSVLAWLWVSLLLPTLPPGGPAYAGDAYSLRSLARTGDAVPGGGSFDRFGQEALPIVAPVNAKGDVAFFATLSRGVSDEGIFLQRAGRIVTVAREGDRVAGVGQLSGFGKHPTPALNDAGTVAFAAAVTGGRAVEGIFTWSAGRLRAIATTGTPVPGMPSTVLAGVDAPTINARGDVVFLATVRRGRESSEAILASRGGVLRKVVAQGDPAPAGGIFATFGSPALNASGSVAFAAVVEGKSVPGGIFVVSRDRIEMAVAAGAETPIGGIFAKFSERIAYNDSGAIAFHGILKFAPVGAAIFVVENGRPRAVAQLGDTAPDGGTIAHFGLWPAIDSAGAAIFASSIEGGPTSVAILQADGTGLTRIAGVGDPLPGGGRIASFTLYPVVSVGPRGHVSFAVAPTASSEGPEGLFAAQPAPAR